MKRLIFIYSIFFSILFSTIHIFCVTNSPYIQSKVFKPLFFEELPQPSYFHEGFCGDSLVKTNVGYKPIQECKEGDTLVDCYNQEKKIVHITKKFVKRYVRLVIDDVIMNVGFDQQYCVLPEHTWMPAKNIKVGDELLTNSHEKCTVAHAQLIYRETLLYSFTVEDHIFYIAPNDICVHNAEALTLGIATICLEYITLVNPIIATLGATAALSTVFYKAYNEQERPLVPVLVERSYYEQRKSDLENIRQELLCVKYDLAHIKMLCGNGLSCFTNQFLQQTSIADTYCQNQVLKISVAQEKQLSEHQKIELRIAREIELNALEQEIIALQCMLALHCNTVIEQVYAAAHEYNMAKEQVDATRTSWKNGVNVTDFMFFQLYDAEIIGEYLLNDLNQKVDELKAVINYYHNCTSMCLKESTDIIDVLETQKSIIIKNDQEFQKSKVTHNHNISVIEQYFSWRDIFVVGIKNETKNLLEKAQKNNAGKMLIQLQNKLSNMVSSGGPYRDPKDNEPKENVENKKDSFKTSKEATQAAKELGFEKTNYYSQGQPVFKKGGKYITSDVTCHNGGVWKMADSVENLGSKSTRMGTYDAYLNRIGD